MHALKLIGTYARVSLQKDLAYRTNFWISLLHSIINLGIGILSLQILFHRVDSIRGWNSGEAFSLLGVYLIVSSLRGLFIGPSLEALAGMGQEIWSGNFDFILLKPVSTQFLVTFRFWNFYSLFDLAFGIGVLIFSIQNIEAIGFSALVSFLIALFSAVLILYSVLLAFTALTFWSPGFLFTWVFDSLFQLARYPVTIYPPWLRIILTWIIPVGVMTTIPAQALTGKVEFRLIVLSCIVAFATFITSSWFFNRAIRKYASASS